MKYNCCQQSELCPSNRMCRPNSSLQKSWKRFICEQQENNHGNNNSQPITATSCQGYAKGSRAPGVYKVMGSDLTIYEVYCYFDSHGSWTLVQSYSYESALSGSSEFRTPLSVDNPVSENALAWNGYRLSKQRMKSIEKNSSLLLFTCSYEETYDVNKSDHMELLISDLVQNDIVDLSSTSRVAWVKRLKVGETTIDGRINQCSSAVYQYSTPKTTLHGRSFLYACNTGLDSDVKCLANDELFSIFGSWHGNLCQEYNHKCVQSGSTTQIWFGG